MARPVDHTDAARRITEFGDRALLVTTGDDSSPHVVTALVAIGPDHLSVRVGPRTRHNVAHRPRITLTWLPVDNGEYQLILDGEVVALDPPDEHGVSHASIVIDRGILHRLAGLPRGPACIAV
jgi:hypothetical protein